MHYQRWRKTGNTGPAGHMQVRGKCSFADCGRPHAARGLCAGHYRQSRSGDTLRPLRRTGVSAAEKLDMKTQKTSTCWNWGGALSRGYGVIRVDGKKALAHRVSYELANGPIPEGLQIDHMCHNRRCVNPSHLQAVTAEGNRQNLSGAYMNSQTGVRGVHPLPDGRFSAFVKHRGKSYSVGAYTTVEEAASAVVAKRNELFTNNLLDRAEQEE